MTEIAIIGGGVIGLACGLELARRNLQVTILERDLPGQGATWAAAGMLAPTAEALIGELADLANASLSLYPNWISEIQGITGDNSGFWQCGILALDPNLSPGNWLSARDLAQKQAGLNLAGAHWLESEGQVDNRRLVTNLELAARSLGVQIQAGIQVEKIATHHDRVTHLQTSLGEIRADRYLLAAGAWTRALLPLPITPRKGQMLAVLARDRPLNRIIYGAGIYLVPRQDGRIIIGASVEDVGFLPGNQAATVQGLLARAIDLYPAIAAMEIIDTWWGFRPHVPGEMPILGASDYQNLALALGHYRNGILLAPITAQVVADFLTRELA
ncbi:MAG: glycine oxidase ThiO [Pseudanabaenaceae cyanobacterium bins.68]|nr:glycine oxidase ThiO [Pseudanabaenaceae cyanobacterium bins.68]